MNGWTQRFLKQRCHDDTFYSRFDIFLPYRILFVILLLKFILSFYSLRLIQSVEYFTEFNVT